MPIPADITLARWSVSCTWTNNNGVISNYTLRYTALGSDDALARARAQAGYESAQSTVTFGTPIQG